ESSFIPIVSFSYDADEYCQNGVNPVITLAGDFTLGGIFSSTEGLSIDPATGEITLSTSDAGTYEVTYTYTIGAGVCGENASHTVSVTVLASGNIITDFSYADACTASQTNPVPTTVTGFTTGGVYSVNSTDLTIDPATGVIDLSETQPGTYEITYTIAASQCAAEQSSTTEITIHELTQPVVDFSYTDACQATQNQLPQLASGFTSGGTFSSDSISVNPDTGEIDMSNPTAGIHEITYTFLQDDVNCIAADSFTTTLYIEASFTPVTDFWYADQYCFGQGNDIPSYNEDFFEGGTFSATDGLTIDPLTGEIDVINSSSGTHTVTYTVEPDAETCNTGGSSSFTLSILPEILISLDGGCENNVYWLNASPLEGSFNEDTVVYSWSVNEQPLAASGASFNVSEYLNSSGNTDFPLTFTVTVTDGSCSGVQSITITQAETICTIQKGISPGGDNPDFDLSGFNVRQLSIFNRYGVKVYSQGNYVRQWHGQDDKGNELPDGTYYYVIELSGETKTGWIYINRKY
ncbi:MAG: gliding motility-associated C-terminal domain-containing protein, partial [Dissulfurispiraceae bacterium]|nr:gliding motility-associated C-terminal domain-containing protein [Dissulfurispiraceae bacterium]